MPIVSMLITCPAKVLFGRESKVNVAGASTLIFGISTSLIATVTLRLLGLKIDKTVEPELVDVVEPEFEELLDCVPIIDPTSSAMFTTCPAIGAVIV